MSSSTNPSTVDPVMTALPLAAGIYAPDRTDRDQLRRLLAMHPAINVVATPDALDALDWSSIRLLFCDLAGDVNATLTHLQERPSSVDVILTSAEERWAATAFEVDALDFLVKPVTRERLGRTVRRLLRLDWSQGAKEAAPPGNRVFIPLERGRRLVSIDEICAIQAVGNYTRVLLAGGTSEIVLRPLLRWEETLERNAFLRIHRATIVNVARIRSVEMTSDGDGALALVDGLNEQLAVSRRCLSSVRAVLSTARPHPGGRSSDKVR